MINYIIPMAGRGSRFSSAGYLVPKWRIEASGKTLLEWSIDSLPLDICNAIVFIALKDDAIKYDLNKLIHQKYGLMVNKIYIHLIDSVTRGQAETALMARPYLDESLPIGIFNIDTKFHSTTLRSKLLRSDVDGVLGSFESVEPRFSYAKLDDQGFVESTAEKVVISSNALTGFYGFSKGLDFFNVAMDQINSGNYIANEYYIAPLYNQLISKEKKFIIDLADSVDILGTPLELEAFLSKSKSIV